MKTSYSEIKTLYTGPLGVLQILSDGSTTWYEFTDNLEHTTHGSKIKEVLVKSQLTDREQDNILKEITMESETIYNDDQYRIDKLMTNGSYAIYKLTNEQGKFNQSANLEEVITSCAFIADEVKTRMLKELIQKRRSGEMSREDLVIFAETFFAKNVEIMKRKNADYSGSGPDPFANFRSIELLGITDTETGFLTRMMDKLLRINNIIKSGKTAVLDEQVEDTLSDLANYAMLMAAYLKTKS